MMNVNTSFQLFGALPAEVLLDVIGLYLPPSIVFTQLVCLNHEFHQLVFSDASCRRQLVQLHHSVQHLCDLSIASFTIKQWPDFDSSFSLFRGLSKFTHLLGHWRTTSSYLGQLVCFSLNVHKRCIIGTHVDSNVQANRMLPVMQVDILSDRPSEAFYLDSASNKHPCSITLHRSSLRHDEERSPSDPRLAEFIAPVLSSSFDQSIVQSFSMTCPSLPPRNHIHEIVQIQHLDTPRQRQLLQMYYPNPQILMHRLPIPSLDRQVYYPSAPFPPPGLYVGEYGPHGPEVMCVEYDWDHKEMVASKILGDANVPAGKVSFRISLPDEVWPRSQFVRPTPFTNQVVSETGDDDTITSRVAHFHRPRIPRQPELPVLTTHSGRGTIALRGFENPQTVDVHCFFHAENRFTLEFLGFILFKPFSCPFHTQPELSE